MVKGVIRRHLLLYALTILFGLGGAIAMGLFSLKTGGVIDSATQNTDMLFRQGLWAFLMLMLLFLCNILENTCQAYYIQGINKDLKAKLSAALYKRELYHFKQKGHDYYLNQLTKNIDLLTDNYLVPRCNIVIQFFQIIASIGFIVSINWQLALALLVIVAITIIVSQLPGLVMRKKTVAFTQANEQFLLVVNQLLRGFEQIKLLNLTQIFRKRFEESDNDFENKRRTYHWTNWTASSLGLVIAFTSQLACMGIGVWFVIQGQLTTGLLIAAVNLLNSVFQPAQSLAYNRNLMSTVTDIMAEFNTLGEENHSLADQVTLQGPIDHIEIHDLSLAYNEDKVIFDHFQTSFQRGRHYAIIGESGRGKSTLMKLIMKYYPASAYSGVIEVNGQNIEQLSTESLYGRMAFIQRNDFFIPGSVEENIELYRELKKDPRPLYHQLKFTDVFLQKPLEQGSETHVSSGEAQRINIARFLVEDYDVLIFDEPTANLDPVTRDIIFDLIFSLDNKLILVITHVDNKAVLQRFDDVLELK